ncbi:DsbA family oxidoreductase [Myceligenerans indicum]|uniref:DsbA family oxidoreductase n=1 Tax=Myceligenerans indicum TaxID=2593663 RepID=A0ABS1LH65_9MICO|nr:DsbA family oxidoreductase [Myceligenerans indicum]MBL0885488.1 DsbA family oxidoreductase [Myceligenerans indicum]
MSIVMQDPIKVDIWTDVICVWCHIGKRKFEAGRDAFLAAGGPPVEVELHSFQLDRNPPVEYGGRYTEYLTDVAGLPAKHVRDKFTLLNKVGAELGLTFDWDNLQPALTLRAHQATHFAKAHGKQAEMNDRLLAAYFERGEDIDSLDQIIAIASEIGLDAKAVRRSLISEEYLPAIEADIARAEQFGITSVPFFVIDGKYGVSGAQSPGIFERALARAAGDRP